MFDEFSRQCFQVGLVFALLFSGLIYGSGMHVDPGARVIVALVCGFGFSSCGVIPVLAIHYLMMTYRNRRGE
jgi:hypothetical protein